MCMKQRWIWGSNSEHKKTNNHSGVEQERGPWIIVKGLIDTVTMNDSVSPWKTKLKQNPNPNVAAATEYMRFRSWMTPLEMPLWAPRRYTGERPKRLCRSSLTYSGHSLYLTIPVDSNEFGPQTSAVGCSLKLSFHPYKEHPKRTPYVAWASILVRAAPALRDGLQL